MVQINFTTILASAAILSATVVNAAPTPKFDDVDSSLTRRANFRVSCGKSATCASKCGCSNLGVLSCNGGVYEKCRSVCSCQR
ncbi:hypothetical protein CPB83DRAFT_863644 [Crepidotus variabilis]|uniref:Invertebrate defensins family profile domain-containing protein n=1 Tax=Crepidotus variabilis TaxID=179855 RepID=A0A9P6JJH5_9AGAR|nr:hypothetical protein CPB83DRAFT_863644 [Crepidotus variabilis]